MAESTSRSLPRELRFESLAEVAREAERLHAQGYRSLGRWDLAQVCNHLADWLSFPVDGFPTPPLLVRPVLALLRMTVAGSQLRRVLATGRMPAGGPTMPATVHAPGGDPAAALERLGRAVERFEAHAGPFQRSPLFGLLDRPTATRLQLVHCAHHMGFLEPAAAGRKGDT